MSDFTSESAESPDYHPSRFLPSIGELLVSLCSQAATALADGGHIERCAAQISEREKKETDLSELELIQHFGKQHSSLRFVSQCHHRPQSAHSPQRKAAAVVCSAAERARAVWRDDPELLQLSWPLQSPLARSLPPKAEAQIEVGFSPAALEIMPDPSWRDGYAAQLDEDPGKGNEWVEAPTSEDDIYSKVQDLLATLSSRGKGKGQYTCPYGVACPRDGVDSNGHIRIFERNSDFRYV